MATVANAPNPSSFNSVSGALLRALSPSSDFCLVELSEPIPASFRPYFAGWDRRGTPVVRSAGIHHPEGDIKKICFDHDPADKVLNTGIETWHIASWDLGVTEPGSSGSPLFDQNQRVVGQLFGGEAACGNVVNDYYGRLEMSWDLGMSLWLDPLGGGEGYMDGMELGAPPGNPHTYCTAKTTSLGSTAAIGWSGSTSVAANDLLVQCSGAIPNKLGLVFFGSQPRSAPFYGGWLCATSPLKRSPLFAFDSSGFHAAAASSADEDVATTRYYQFWFRDGGHPDGTGVGLSDALKVTFDP